MLPLLLVLLSFIPAGDGFVDASASGTAIGRDRIRVDLQVRIDGAGSVVAHLIAPGAEQQTVSLRDRGGGEFGAVLENRQIDLVVVFEVLGEDPRQSEALRLSELGVSREVLGMPAPLVVVTDEDANSQWGWLGLGLAALALALLAVWVLGGDDRVSEVDSAAMAESE